MPLPFSGDLLHGVLDGLDHPTRTRADATVDVFSTRAGGLEWLVGEADNSRDDGFEVIGDPLDGVLEIRDGPTSVTYSLTEIPDREVRGLKFRIPDPPGYRRPRLP